VIVNRVLSIQAAGWMTQIAAIIALLLFSTRRHDPKPTAPPGRASWSHCALAVCGAWAWRLACLFLLASLGFHYSIPDDASRFYLSWGWYSDISDHVGWHMARRHFLRKRPCHASNTRSLGRGQMRCSVIQPVSVARRVPVYGRYLPRPPALDSSGAVCSSLVDRHCVRGRDYAGTPLVGCLLCGAGLLLIGLSATPRYRSLAWWAAALCFAAATSFHMLHGWS